VAGEGEGGLHCEKNLLLIARFNKDIVFDKVKGVWEI
jgi:hypothetical protein